MGYSRRSQAKRPIHSNKEIVDTVALLVVGGTITDVNILETVNNYTGTVGTAALGSSVLGFYLETSVSGADSIVARTDWYLCKRPGNRTLTDYPTPGSTGGSPQRKWIFHESKGIAQGESVSLLGGQTTRTREFIKIPKGYRRCGENDRWTIRIGSSADYNYCLKCIYKVYE